MSFPGFPKGPLLSAGTNIGNGSWTLTPAQLTGLLLTPPPGSDADFTLTVTAISTETDGQTATTATTIAITITAVNDAPVAVADTLAASEDTVVTYTAAQLLGNDTDVDGDTLTIAAVMSGAGGTAVLNGTAR